MDYVLGGYYRENNTRTLVFPRPTNVPATAVAWLHIDVGADVAAYEMDTETVDGDVFDSFTALSGLTEYVAGWRASIKYVASNGDIWASGNFELNIKERVDGDEAIISANPDVLEALQATALDHEARIAAIEASSGTGSHNSLSGRDAEDAHPISAITGLATALGTFLTTAAAETTYALKSLEHSHTNKGTLDSITAAFTTALKTAYDQAVLNSHTHNNKNTLDTITGVKTAAWDEANAHVSTTNNPHGVTKSQVGLGNVDNTSDADKPLSTAAQTALAGKSDTTHNHDGDYAPTLGADDNYVTDAEKAALHSHSNKTALDAVSGTNTGDQTLSGLGGVPTTRTVNGKALSEDITLSASDVGAIDTETDPTVPSWAKQPAKPTYNATDVGAEPAGAVAGHNSSSMAHEDIRSSIDAKADLVDGLVPSSQLPSYVDDILEYADLLLFPETGESGKIYIALDTNKAYRWSGTQYAEVSESLALGETSATAYRGDRGKDAYNHSQTAHAPSNAEQNVQSDWNVTDNTSDAFIKNKITDISQLADENNLIPTNIPEDISDLTDTTGVIPTEPVDIGAEPALGNPASDGMVLVSTAAGVRSWAAGGTGSGDTYPRGTSFPASPTAGDAFYRTDRKVLYVYEGGWQPIESYGDITLYLSATGNDANTGWSAGDPVATLSRLWSMIPRLYGGNVTVVVSGVINVSDSITTLEGKYSVAGAYWIIFIGIDGTVLKNDFTATIDETVSGKDGLLEGLSGMSASVYRGKLLKNVTNNWYTVIFDNTPNNIRTVGRLVKPVNGTYSPFRTVATTDTWRIMEFGGSFNFTASANSTIQVRSNNVMFTNMAFSHSSHVAIVEFYGSIGKLMCCNSVSGSTGSYAYRAMSKASAIMTDVMCTRNSGAIIADTFSSVTCEGIGSYNTGSFGITLQSASVGALVDAFRFAQPSTAGTGLNVRHISQMLLYSSAVPANCQITNFTTGLNVGLFSQTNGIAAKIVFTGCTTDITADASTSNGIAG